MKKKIFGIGICLFIFILTGLIFFNSDSFKEKKEEYNKKQVTVKYEKIANKYIFDIKNRTELLGIRFDPFT